MTSPPHAAAMNGSSNLELWSRVDQLIDRAPRLSDVKAHRLSLLAGRHWRATGREVPREVEKELRVAALTELVTPVLLERVRAAVDGPIVVMKGSEVSARYPARGLRPFGDIDLLVPDAQAAQRALVRAGFRPVGLEYLYIDIHHLQPLAHPHAPLIIEVHSEPKWVDGLRAPAVDELLASAVPSASGVAGVSTLAPAQHALVLAAHSWAHHPLRRLGDFVDVAVMSDGVDEGELDTLAQRWGLGRVWRTTKAAVDASLFGERDPWALRIWARNLPAVRERTVLETHLDRLFASFWSLPPHRAAGAMRAAIGRAIRPEPWEDWHTKLTRTQQALGNAFLRKSEHEDALGQLSWSELVGRAIDAGDTSTIRKLGITDPERARR